MNDPDGGLLFGAKFTSTGKGGGREKGNFKSHLTSYILSNSKGEGINIEQININYTL